MPGASPAAGFAAARDAIAALATERWLVLVLEDLQWAGAASLELLRVVARQLQGLRLLPDTDLGHRGGVLVGERGVGLARARALDEEGDRLVVG